MSDETAPVAEKAPIVMNAKPTYNPANQYTWDPEATFTLTGKQFGLWLNTLRGIVSSKEAMELRMAMECNDVIEGLMVDGVASGVIKEIPKEAPTS